MKVTMNKCEYCGECFESEKEYKRHVSQEKFVKDTEIAFNLPFEEEHKAKGCDFGNGSHCYVMPIMEYHRLVMTLKDRAVKDYPCLEGYDTKTYYFGRYLDDSDSVLRSLHYHIDCICSICGRIHGQPYYAINCTHTKDAIII